MNIKRIRIAALILISSATALLSGCAGNISQSDITDSPTMAQSYQEAMHESNGNSLAAVRRHVQGSRAAMQGAVLTQKTVASSSINTQVAGQFPTLPNHNIIVYVYPHLAGQDQMPVNGYYTAVPFYTEVHYAIPGERGAYGY